MTEKELEAIKDTEELIKSMGGIDSKYLKECEPENYKLCMSLSIVLNLITEKQKGIEIHKGNFETLSADIIQVKKDLGLPEDLIIADEMVIEIKKKYVEKDKYENAKKDSDKWFKKLQEVQKKENIEKKKLNEIIDNLIVCLAEEQGVEEDEIREAFCHE